MHCLYTHSPPFWSHATTGYYGLILLALYYKYNHSIFSTFYCKQHSFINTHIHKQDQYYTVKNNLHSLLNCFLLLKSCDMIQKHSNTNRYVNIYFLSFGWLFRIGLLDHTLFNFLRNRFTKCLHNLTFSQAANVHEQFIMSTF